MKPFKLFLTVLFLWHRLALADQPKAGTLRYDLAHGVTIQFSETEPAVGLCEFKGLKDLQKLRGMRVTFVAHPGAVGPDSKSCWELTQLRFDTFENGRPVMIAEVQYTGSTFSLQNNGKPIELGAFPEGLKKFVGKRFLVDCEKILMHGREQVFVARYFEYPDIKIPLVEN